MSLYKDIAVLLIGTALLSVGAYKKHIGLKAHLNSISQQVQMTAILMVLFKQMTFFQSEGLSDNFFEKVAFNFIPLLYGAILYLIIVYITHILVNEDDVKKVNETDNLNVKKSYHDLMNSHGLTQREFEIIQLILEEELTNQEICDKLYISVATVKKHLQNAYSKLQVSNRQQLRRQYKE